MDDLDTFLEGKEAEPAAEASAEAAPTPEPVAEEPKGPERDEQGRFKPKGDTTAAEQAPEPAAPPAAEENPVPVKALQEERRKRQELEARVEELMKRLEPPPQPAQPLPSVFEDEDGFSQSLEERAVRKAIEALNPQMQQQMQAMMIEMKRQTYRTQYTDFSELETELFEEMKGNPALAQQVSTAEDPVEFGYRYMKNKKEVATLGSLDLEAIKSELREQLKAEMAVAPPAPSIPDSLAGSQSSRSSAVVPAGPPSLADILGS